MNEGRPDFGRRGIGGLEKCAGMFERQCTHGAGESRWKIVVTHIGATNADRCENIVWQQ